MPTVEEMIAMEYAPPKKDFTSGDYLTQYEQHGRPFRWWKAFKARRGMETAKGPGGETIESSELFFIEQTTDLSGASLSAARCMVWATQRNMVDEEYGIIEKGSTQISVVPSQVVFARYDRVLITDHFKVTCENLLRADSGDDALEQNHITAITQVIKIAAGQDGVIVPDDEYELLNGALHWINNNTVSPDDCYSVMYRYSPLYQWLEEGNRGVMQRGTDGSALPQRGVLREVK